MAHGVTVVGPAKQGRRSVTAAVALAQFCSGWRKSYVFSVAYRVQWKAAAAVDCTASARAAASNKRQEKQCFEINCLRSPVGGGLKATSRQRLTGRPGFALLSLLV